MRGHHLFSGLEERIGVSSSPEELRKRIGRAPRRRSRLPLATAFFYNMMRGAVWYELRRYVCMYVCICVCLCEQLHNAFNNFKYALYKYVIEDGVEGGGLAGLSDNEI